MNDERNRIGEQAEPIMKTVARFLDAEIVPYYIPMIVSLIIVLILPTQLEPEQVFCYVYTMKYFLALDVPRRNSIIVSGFLVLRSMSTIIILFVMKWGFGFLNLWGATVRIYSAAVFIYVAQKVCLQMSRVPANKQTQKKKKKKGRVLGLGEQLVSDLNLPLDMVLEKEGYTKDCIQYCSLFPIDYEFTRDTLVWSWNAAGFINSKQHGKMDQVAAGNCFDRFIRSNYIVPIGYDHSVDQMRYKLASNYKNLDIEQSSVPSYQKGLDMDMDVAKLEHLSLISDWITDQTLEILRKCPQLKTLLLHQCHHSSKLERLLDSLFLELKLLKVLDLSRTIIEELPSSVENLKELRYLDMSETPIRRLPESIQSLKHLETLILLGCLNLCGLPKCMYKLISLKHLVLDIARMLQSMPMGIGKLTNLQTLSAFLVGTKDGNCIAELRNLNNLKGSLCILKLENIQNKEEARKALLSYKNHLVKVEYIWSDFQDVRATIEEEILENLQPHFGLQELKIVSYSGGVLPSWISDPSYSQLISITLHGCRYCEILPSLGTLPLLKILDIIDMDGVVDIDSLFCRQQTNRNYKNAFPQLEKLSFDGMSSLEIWRGVRDGDFRNLQQLVIKYCPKLIGLPSLSHLSSLGHLEISYCPDIPCLPEGDLPASLKCIMVKGCPIIKERCGSEQGEDWVKIVTVPSLYIDDQKII